MLTKVSYKLFTENHVFDDLTDKQSKILIAAIKVFAEKGYSNSSTKEIAEEAGVAEGNIFSRFTNKRGLLQAIIDPVIQSIFPATLNKFTDAQIVDKYTTLHAFIEASVKDRVRFMEENADVLKIFMAEMIYDDQLRADFQDQFASSATFYLENINRNLSMFKANQFLVNWANTEILRIMWSVVAGLVVSYLFFKQPVTSTEINHTVDALTKALSQKMVD
ncbi:TetR/AcrR family transcriptional regulator [Lentilactobacillus hilgardii]|uniref:Transcriptional regulator, TetR family n=1 Tax=Lentilactobacillus hilgardii (strain ATCC 8290 / DSM 20176 / CCUG 30140 / JCM 1155 / KCTC 3500 / NBRC 15886 / NCIMB 8040 / NRRL B-1843 / 9) TaxID=1423757 RepID=C0XNA7_LENH9|nr:TetR/AcrR family transcriptional regulator [Lentilactobacillus hilgardii]EEI23132.1 transcriptional regulator, TetR family [Lentilactobacillus hilgardii DSM 20176 = ATCC 8290]KRK56299.1 transcriptional regulator [Lentilactobacillus hilgardii DSM 20176 = ATCC 8290]QEU38130.1 TetR/AcrR family transcriptional regulator [Lentilactobacillus hilgardii]TDG80111.1 hypothetical protein C5L34_001109 [Lentilactobacillus hilgardii]